MNEAALFEKLGRLQFANEGLINDYRVLLGIVARIKSGELDADLIDVDMDALSWKINPPPMVEPDPPPVTVEVPAEEPVAL